MNIKQGTPIQFSIALPTTAKNRPDCQVTNDLFDLHLNANKATLTLPDLPRWQAILAAWDLPENRPNEIKLDELLDAPEQLEQRRCIPPASALQLRQLLRETLPLRPSQSLFGAYGHRAGTGALDLRPGLRLKIVRAHFTKPPEQRKSPADGYRGLTTANYDCFEDAAGKVGFRLASIEDDIKGLPRDARFAKQAPPQRVYRFLMLTHYVSTGRKRSAIIIGAQNLTLIHNIESKLRQNPAEPCPSLTAGTKAICLPFEGEVTVSPEIQVTLNDKSQYVAWGSTIKNLLTQAKASEAKSIRLRRSWENQLRPVEIEGDPAAILSTVLIGGDEVQWKQ